MSLGYAYVETTVRIDLHWDIHAAAYGHCRGYSYDFGVLFHEFQEGLAEYVLEQGRLTVSVTYYALAGNLVKESGACQMAESFSAGS